MNPFRYEHVARTERTTQSIAAAYPPTAFIVFTAESDNLYFFPTAFIVEYQQTACPARSLHRYALGQISWLVDIGAFDQRGVVGQ